jgi:PAS domain S-box-containing protein
LGPFIYLYVGLVGFFLAAAMILLILWGSTRRKLLVAVFGLDCTLRALIAGALVLVATASTPAEAESALALRVAFAVLATLTSLWSLTLLSGVRAPWVVWPATVILLGFFAVHTTVLPLNAPVLALDPLTLPWGETIAHPRLGPAGWWFGPIYGLAVSLQFFGIYCGLVLRRRDWLAGAIVTTASVGMLVVLAVDVLRNLGVVTLPFVGVAPQTLWVGAIATVIAREHNRTRNRLVASEQRFRGIFDQTLQFVGLLDTDGNLLEANRTALEFIGVRAADVIGRPFWDCPWWSHSIEAQARLKDAIQRARSGETVRFVTTHANREGGVAHIDFSLKPVRDEHGVITLLIPEGRDISDHKEAEETIGRILEAIAPTTGQDFFRALANHLSRASRCDYAFVGAIDPRDATTIRTLAVSRRGEAIENFSYTLKDTPCENLIDHDLCFYPSGVQRTFPQDTMLGEMGIESYMGIPLKSRTGQTLGLVAMLHDRPMTKPQQSEAFLRVVAARAAAELEREQAEASRRTLESQLAQHQKMEAIGQLAAGVAHDFNNLLTVINGGSELLQAMHTGENQETRLLREIQDAGKMAASLTRQLLTFSKQQVVQPRVLDLNVVVRDTEVMMRRLIEENISLVTRLHPRLAPVMADPVQVGQVIMNLVVNARDAMPEGGVLTLETTNVDVDAARAAGQAGAVAGAYVMLSVSDTGCGMTPEVQARLFEPFFTTKGPGQGTGLGLATVTTIVQESRGFMSVKSAPGQGSTFQMLLPALPETARPTEPEPEQKPSRPGQETILVVEDDDAVRNVTRHVLERLGYQILEAAGGVEALALLEQHAGSLDLVVTDVVMPGLSGPDLVDRLLVLRPDLRVIYVSGYTDKTVIRHGVLDADVAFLQKPFTIDELAGKVRQILDSVVPGTVA